MSSPAPDGARCGNHLSAPATWCCGRCGTFICTACERRTRPEALPMCPGCWDKRAQSAQAQAPHSTTRLQTLGLVLGCISLLPIPAVQLSAVLVCIIGWVKARAPELATVRWKPKLGLGLAATGILIDVLLIALLAGLKRF